MQTYFEEELAKLRTRILKMFNLVESQLEKSFHILINGDFEEISLIKENETHVDKLDIKIDKLCQRIFALAQPVAGDLRFIMSSLRIGNEMERIADMAFDITKRSETISQFPEIITIYRIKELTEKICQIFNQTGEAYTNNNVQLATEIIASCKKADENCKTMFNEIVAEMTEKSKVILVATDLILTVRNLERIIGHIENIAESIIFIVEAKIVKHPNIKKSINKK